MFDESRRQFYLVCYCRLISHVQSLILGRFFSWETEIRFFRISRFMQSSERSSVDLPEINGPENGYHGMKMVVAA